MSQLLKAKQFASEAHKGDTYGEYKYTKHLNDVHNNLVLAGVRDELILVVAWLHDTIEDTHVRYEDIFDEFGKRVADMVYNITDKRGKNRRERHEATYPPLSEHPKCTLVKWADRAANFMSSQHSRQEMFYKYVREHEYFKEILYKKFNDPEVDAAIEFLSKLIDDIIEQGPFTEDP